MNPIHQFMDPNLLQDNKDIYNFDQGDHYLRPLTDDQQQHRRLLEYREGIELFIQTN